MYVGKSKSQELLLHITVTQWIHIQISYPAVSLAVAVAVHRASHIAISIHATLI